MKNQNSDVKKKISREELGAEKISELNYHNEISESDSTQVNYPFNEDEFLYNKGNESNVDNENQINNKTFGI